MWYEWLPPVRVDVYLWAFVRVNLFDWRPAEHGGPFDESGVTTLLDVAVGMWQLGCEANGVYEHI
jgi:hypothetical protein